MAKDTTADATYTLQFFMPDVYSVHNYYAFGQSMPNWSSTAAVNDPKKYRFGMNGQERDTEFPGGNTYYAEFWEYDARSGRRFNLDPRPNESLSSYSCFANNTLEDKEMKALAIGYFKIIHDTETNVSEILKSNENISEYGRSQLPKRSENPYLKGKDVENLDGGGRTLNANGFDGLVKHGNSGTYIIMSLNPSHPNSLITYTEYLSGNKIRKSPLAGETFAHEMIGYGLGMRYFMSTGKDQSIQVSNLYLGAKRSSCFRPDHGDLPDSPNFNPKATPHYLMSLFY